MRILVRFFLDDLGTAEQRQFEKEEEWPWPWPPQAGLAVQVRGFRSRALIVERVIYDMNRGGLIMVDFVGSKLGGDVDGAAQELRSIGYVEVGR